MELEVRRRADIHTCVKSYVEKSVSQGRRVDADAYARDHFRTEPPDLQSKLVERVGEIIAALNDANHIAYGISKKVFGDYQRLPVLRKARKPRSGVS